MLNIFPIQFLALFAYFLLRLFVGGILLYLGISHIKHRSELSSILSVPWWPFPLFNTLILVITEWAIALSIIFGAYTQLGAMVLMALSIKMIIFRKRWQHASIPGSMTYILLLGCGLTLFITGAGVLAFDLPI